MRVTRFVAKYDGSCTDCGADFEEGDTAGFVGFQSGIHCADCLDYYDTYGDDDAYGDGN